MDITIQGLIQKIIDSILAPLPALLIGIALVVFLWGMVKFIWTASDSEEKKKGRQLMVWGIIGLFVMVSVWGLVTILVNSLGIDPEVNPPIPQVSVLE